MTVIDMIQHNPAVLIVLAVILGLLVGSFLNVVIYRLPLMMQREWSQQCCEFLELEEKKFSKADPVARHKVFTLAKPDSHCPLCNALVRPWQNVPIISYALLRGRCASCKAPISIRYPLIEAVTGVLSGMMAWHFGATALTLALLVLIWSLIALTMIDFDHQLAWPARERGAARRAGLSARCRSGRGGGLHVAVVALLGVQVTDGQGRNGLRRFQAAGHAGSLDGVAESFADRDSVLTGGRDRRNQLAGVPGS